MHRVGLFCTVSSDEIVTRPLAANALWAESFLSQRTFLMDRTTGPLMKEGELFRFAPFGYTATKSHRLPSCSQQSGSPCRTCCFNSLETKCPLSQYCAARRSDSRESK